MIPSLSASMAPVSNSAFSAFFACRSSFLCPFNTRASRYSVVPSSSASSDKSAISSFTSSRFSSTSRSCAATEAVFTVASCCPAVTASPASTRTSSIFIPTGTVTFSAVPCCKVPVPSTVVLMLPVSAVADCTVVSADALRDPLRPAASRPTTTTTSATARTIPASFHLFFLFIFRRRLILSCRNPTILCTKSFTRSMAFHPF